MYLGKKVCVVIPAYNEEILIQDTLESVPNYIDKIYVIDDGSIDNTYKIIESYVLKGNLVVPIKHTKNKGVGAAIVSGYKKSLEDNMDISIVIGGDHQMDPIYFPLLLKPIIEGKSDYAKGNRLSKKGYTKGMSNWRLFGNYILTLLTRVSSGYWNITDPQNGYTAISKFALEKINPDSIYTKYGYCNDILCKLNCYNFNVIDVSIPAKYGNEKSKIRYFSYIIKISFLLIKNFCWRLRIKYVNIPIIFR